MLLPGASATCMTTTLRPHAESVYILLLPSREQKLKRSIMKLLKVRLFSCVVGAVLIALLLAPAVAQAQATPWTVVPSPSPGSENELNGVASVSANDVWSVGDTDQQTLTEHWNGTAWSVVASPNASSNDALLGVAAVSTKDVWAVGKVNTATPPLIEHWNGTSWRLVKAPKQVGFLNGVTAVSARDVWAVGDFVSSGVDQTLIEHWNGHKWSVVSSPNVVSQNNFLNGVTAVSATDIWAVGFAETSFSEQTLTLHWDGTSWSVVSSPNVAGSASDTLLAAAAVSSNDVWAVGPFISGSSVQTLIEQWNGTSWSVVPSPNPSASQNILSAAAADPSSGQAWAVGNFFSSTSNGLQTLTEFNP